MDERDLGEEFLPPLWMSIPFEFAVETALAKSWGEKRGVNPQDLALGVGAAGLQGQLGVCGRVIPITA